MQEYQMKLVQAINNTNSAIAQISEMLLETTDENLFAMLQNLKQINFRLSNEFDEYLLSKSSFQKYEFDEDILILIDFYINDIEVKINDCDANSLKDYFLAKKEETKILENRIERYAALINEFAPVFIKDLECKLTCETSYILTSINKILQMIANNRKNYIQ